ncbi:MAG: sigma-54 dependent transcriptional regulator [Candidatus Methylomirabilis sp.]|nr:sigma-54 dependent transcriptional regulator [Candidatus Methylomirabilis sp.]
MVEASERGGATRALVVDDERPIRLLMEMELPRAGYMVTCAANGEEALEQLRARGVRRRPPRPQDARDRGMEALRRIRDSGSAAEVVILTGHPDVDSAIQAMKLGAYDYLTKPFKLAELEEVLGRAAERKRLRTENTALRRMVAQREPAPIMVGHSSAMASLLATVRRIAPSEASVLIQGESGTGKSLVAKAIHMASRRANGPFLIINCSGFQDPLLESELFGHEKGAFTGAVSVKMGLFEVAGGGTLLLDEVGEMSPAMQAKLLQVLDTKELRRVGGTRVHRVEVRIIAATNKDLTHEVRTGRFREDLYYRLNVVGLTLPSLRERKEDIPLLVEHFLQQFRVTGQKAKAISNEAIDALAEYPWPGNVRELANTIERLQILTPGDVIGPEDLPPNIRFPSGVAGGPVSLAEMERLHLIRVLDHTKGKKMQAARLLGIDLKTLNSKIKRYNIPL